MPSKTKLSNGSLRQTIIPKPVGTKTDNEDRRVVEESSSPTLPSYKNNIFKDALTKSFEPKVYVPFKHAANGIPRKVVVERLRRQFEQQEIEETLRNEGIDYSKPITAERKYETYLPLEAFDNTDFDPRTPKEWLSLGIDDESGKFKYIPAKALISNGNIGNWYYCKVYDVNEETNRYYVEFVHQEGMKIWVPRVNLMFLAEDPFNFAKRVSHAFNERKVAESLIRYFLYIDSMPTDEVSIPSDQQIESITKLSLLSKKLKRLQESPTLTDLIEEVKIDFCKSINKMIFDKNMKDPTQRELFKSLELPDEVLEPYQKPVPLIGTITDIPAYPFGERCKQFYFNSYFTEKNILDALLNVKKELIEKQILKIFHLPIKKTVTLDEFEQIQQQAIDSVVTKLTGEWLTNLKSYIQESLIHIEKGWLSVYGKTAQIYGMSKLKRFMNAIRFMMQDSLKYMMQDSFQEYVKYIIESCSFRTKVVSCSNVEVSCTCPEAFMDNTKRATNLFSVELSFKEDKFFYITSIERFKSVVLDMFEKALKEFQRIPDVESQVLTDEFCDKFKQIPSDSVNDESNKRKRGRKSQKMFLWGEVKMLDTLKATDKEVIRWREELETNLNKALMPLKDFLNLFQKYEDLLKIDAQALVNELEQKENVTLDEIKLEIIKHFELKESIRDEIPQKVVTGTFVIDCQSIRNSLSRRCSEIGKSVLKFLARTANEKCALVLETFNKLSREINKPPEDIESLTKLRNRMKEIPNLVGEYEEKIAEMRGYFHVLENDFKYPLTDEEFKNLWSAMSWPKKIGDQIEKVDSFLEKKKEMLRDRLGTDQKSFVKELESIQRVVGGFSKYKDILSVSDVAKEVKVLQKQLQDYYEKAKKFNQKEILFGLEVTEYSQLNSINKQFQPYSDLWLTVDSYFSWEESWSKEPFDNLDAPKIEEEVKNAEKTMVKCMKHFKDSPEIKKIAETIRKKVEEFSPNLPLLLALRNPGMRERHWTSISKDIGLEISPGRTLKSMDDIFSMKLINYEEIIKKYSEIASREYTIEKALKDMQEAWESVVFEVLPYRKSGTYIIKISDETHQQLSEHIALTQTISFSSYKKHFEADLKAWENQLTLVSEIFEEWTNCQREWMALEPIFSAEEMQKQLPQLHKQFKQVDTKWRRIMEGVNRNPNIMSYCTTTAKLLKTFQQNNQILSTIQKGLSNYLEKKRQQFARLYFLADEELLEILAKTRDPTAVQKYLSKIFEGIGEINFVEIPEESKISTKGPVLEMISMRSKAGEEVTFVEKLQPTGSVEVWLKEVERVMMKSVKEQISKSILDYVSTPRGDWVLRWPGQVVILGSQVYWTKEITQSLNEGGYKGLKKYLDVLKEQLLGLIRIVRTDISRLQKTNVEALITIEVHARDVVEKMIEEGVSSVHDFEWVSQMRYYWEPVESNLDQEQNGEKPPDFTCNVKQVESVFEYGYEYLGNTSRLVITPLTDRIYLTLTGALHLGLGGAPAGPAGTGKTETVKDLAKALAKKCVVLNCQEGMRENSMAQIFKGLIQSGSWACFDEFNRIDVEVLSVVAQQLSILQEAARARLPRTQFDGITVTVDPTYAVYITMNPGYAGRTELPDNLKALFRPVACMIPDYALIAEIRLISFGFENAKPLAKKMVQSFKLASEQLSSQDHYDFGMRAVNTVIAAAGLLKKKHPNMNEEVVVLKALRDSNVPKFLVNDVLLFNGIVSDLFPKVTLESTDYEKLNNALSEAAKFYEIELTKVFHEKCIQMYEMTILRHGLMLVGQTGGGKTMCYKTLAMALTTLSKTNKEEFHHVHYSVINPKSVTMEQLYGEYDKNTREWRNGVLASEFRKFGEDMSLDCKWLVFDGPVDALWIESMNTVLDENKKLCLSNGAMIDMSPNMNIVFEVEDLAEASPATVSRCGMIYLDPKATIPPMVHVKSWTSKLSTLLQPHVEELMNLFNLMLEDALYFVRHDVREYIPTVDSNLIHSCFNTIDTLLVEFDPSLSRKKKKSFSFEEEENKGAENKLVKLPSLIEPFFLFSLVWSVGASCDQEGRKLFDIFLREKMKEKKLKSLYPNEGLVYDYFYDTEELVWKNWASVTPELEITSGMQYRDIIVPTIDTVRNSWLLKKLITNDHHVLCVGPTGTGKSEVIMRVLLQGLPEEFVPYVIYFSARTDANSVQDIIDSKLDRRRPGVYGPPQGKKYTFFIDDINMPAKEKYGAQPPIELVRQWMDHSGWYEYTNERLPFRSIESLIFVSACGPPGGGRNTVTNRLMRHFNFISFPELQYESLFKIFNTILTKGYININPGLVEIIPTEISTKFVNSSIELFNRVRQEMLPTPTRSHYTFNLRDLSKIFQGVLQANAKKINSLSEIYDLWVHECSRVFRDRLVDNDDRKYFDNMVSELLTKHFDLSPNSITSKKIVYGDALSHNSDSKSYEAIKDVNELFRVVNEQLEYYNSINSDKKMNLVLFMDAIEHVLRISRIIKQPGGNALLLGVGGSGRQSLTRLAAAMAEYDIMQLEIRSSFTIKDWKEFIKTVLLNAGKKNGRGEPTVFLFCDTQIIYDVFLEDINNLLNSGEIPNLFETPDMDEIYTAMKPICALEKLPATPLSWYNRFIRCVKDNLHIVLAMSPVGEVFRSRLRMFPSLVNCCTIDWFSEWPHEALLSVAREKLSAIQLIGNENESEAITKQEELLKEKINEMCVYIHQSVEKASKDYLREAGRYNFVTPTSYLELLTTFASLLSEKRKILDTEKRNLQKGLSILKETEEYVFKLQQDLEVKKPQLNLTKIEIEKNMEILQVEREQAQLTQERVRVEETEAKQIEVEAREMKKSAEDDLAQVEPMLAKAVENVDLLKVPQIREVANYKSPSPAVVTVLEAVLIMFGETQGVKKVKDGVTYYDWWEAAKGYLSNAAKLKEDMVKYDRENIPESIIKRIQKYYFDEEFQPSRVKEISAALVAMCQWVRAMYDYYVASKEVAPKREKAKLAEDQWRQANEKLEASNKKLRQVMQQLQELEEKNNRALKEREELEAEIDLCEKKLERAAKLIDGLSDEKVRWQEMLKSYIQQQQDIVGNMIINAGVVAYLGAFTKQFRERLIENWRRNLEKLGVPFTENIDTVTSLGDPLLIRSWNQFGLPSDKLSIENAIILSNARRWPLMIDPQLQASQWIKNMEKDKSLKVLSFTKKDYLSELMRAVQFGSPVLIENVGEDIDPAIEPILLKQTFGTPGSLYIKIGEDTIPYSSDFRLYLTTKLRNPKYSPETCVKVTLLNFFITPVGLEDQLLAEVVKMERPELQRLKVDIMQKNSKMKKDLAELQKNILKMLTENQDKDILQNEGLITALGESKIASKSIQEKVEEAEKTEQEIDVTRNKYRPVAERGSLLFFCTSDMTNVDPMYQYSLQWFIHLYKSVIESSEQNDDLDIRLNTLIYNITLSLYNNVCQSLFEKDKLLFSFVLCIRILQSRNQIDSHEFRHFLTGGMKTDEDDKDIARKPPNSSWLNEKTWSEVVVLGHLPVFKSFIQDFIDNVTDFKQYFENPHPNHLPIPAGWDSKLTDFQRIMVIKVLRPDKVVETIQDFVEKNLDKNFITPPRFDLNRSFKDSNCVTPLIFILSQGADPNSELKKFAEQMRVKELISISLGSGTENIAKQAVKDALTNGSWVILQNCHLALGFMPMLEQIVETFSPEQNHADFRLWLTSMPSPKFPISVLQNSVKMTLEPPKGLANNLKGSFDNYNDENMQHPTKPVEFKKLLFSLTFFHAVIQERRKFGPLGWNIFYEFTSGDLDVCIKQLRLFLEKYEQVPYKVIKFLTGQINYGGRVTDDWDRRTLMTLIEDYITPKAMEDGYRFSENLPEYISIKPEEHRNYVEYLEKLPNSTHPEIFGLHENAEITYNTSELSVMTETILSVDGGSGNKSQDDKDIVITNVANDILGKLPEPFDLEKVQRKYPTDYNESMNTVIAQEVVRYNRLLKVVIGSLKEILKALKGQVVMSEELENMSNSIYNNFVPEMWADKGYLSIMPLSEWIIDFLRRLDFINDWIENGVPNIFWINGFFFQQGFLTGILQNYARKHQVAIDQVSFSFKVLTKEEEEKAKNVKPEDGCYVRGLYMEGARWDRQNQCIEESNPKELYCEMPIIWFKPEANRQTKKTGIYECPVYKTLRRAGTLSTTGHSTNYVLTVELPSMLPLEHWVKRGVALICSLRYVTSSTN
ncbi:hypothetical protein ABK040_015890 [Willaertia magna]